MELKLEHVLIFMVFIFLVQFVMRNCHCDFNRLIEGTENERDKTVINLSNLGLEYDKNKVYYCDNFKNWYLVDNKKYSGNFNYTGGTLISNKNPDLLDTLTKLSNIGVYMIAYQSYKSKCRGLLNTDMCGKGRFDINLDKKPNYSYEINWINFHSGSGNKTYCDPMKDHLTGLDGDIYKLTSFTRKLDTTCKNHE